MTRINKFIEIYKQCNNGDNYEKYELISSGKLRTPRYIDVELTNLCNFNCRFCPCGTKSLQRTQGYMSSELTNQ